VPFLQAVIYESMRYHPPSFALMPRVVPPEGDTVLGQFVPGGTHIAVDTWGVMRHKPTFGNDVDVFRPDRWTDDSVSDQQRVEMERTAEFNFGLGRYMCAGKKIAFMELFKLFVEVSCCGSQGPGDFGFETDERWLSAFPGVRF
jgi:cytochrome P450